MFEILPSPSLATVFMVVRALLLIGAFWVFAMAFMRWRRQDEHATQQLQAQLERSFNEIRSLHETVSVMSSRLDALSEHAETGAHLRAANGPTSDRGYDIAARLARNGAPIEELISTCGLTRHEAELLSRLHGARREAHREPARTSLNPPAAWTGAIPANAAPPTPAPAARKKGSLLSVVG